MTGSALRIVMLALLAGLALWAAPAAAQERDCRDDNLVDRCDPEQQARVRALFGVPTIEAHRDAGDQVRRAFYVDGYGRDVIAIAFVRAPGRDPELRVHFAQAEGEPETPPLVALVPPEQWQLLIDRSDHFDRDLVPIPEPADPQIITICSHSWVYTVEAADPGRPQGEPASIRRRTEDSCEHGLAGAYAIDLYFAALMLMPHCGELEPSQHRNPAMQLAACQLLSGDRRAAAEVMNRADAFSRIEGPGDLHRVGRLFDHGATIDWNGERGPERGLNAPARFFLAKVAEGGLHHLFIDGVEGERSDRVRLRGSLFRAVPVTGSEEVRHEQASVEMIWEADYGDEFTIRSVTIGPYRPLPAR